MLNSQTQSRRHARRGSILIMVVAVLVLLALMGTAYISTARLDRVGTPAQTKQTEPEKLKMLMKDLESNVRNTIMDDAFGGTQYDGWDSPRTKYANTPQNDAWLSERTPIVLDVNGLGSVPGWRAISYPLQLNVAASSTTPDMFESPYYSPFAPASPNYPRYDYDASKQEVRITELPITYPTDYVNPELRDRTRLFPAIQIIDLPPGGAPGTINGTAQVKYLAADADGDGVADSGLARLITIDDITYMYAYRVIDDGSAINVNTSMSRASDFNFSAAAVNNSARWTLFPSSLGLAEALSTASSSNEMTLLNERRFNKAKTSQSVPNPQPYNDPEDIDGNQTPANSADNIPTARSDFNFWTIGDAMYHMMTRRMQSPGFLLALPGDPINKGYRYDPLTAKESVDLKYQFSMVYPKHATPTGMATTATNGPMDTIFKTSALTTTANYDPSAPDKSFDFFTAKDSVYWYETMFDYDGTLSAAGFRSLRPLLTTRNPSVNMWAGAIDSQTGTIPHQAMLPYNNLGRWDRHTQYRTYNQSQNLAPSIVTYTNLTFNATTPIQTLGYVAIADNIGVEPNPLNDNPPAQQPTNWAILKPRGVWDAAVAYYMGDVVSYDVDTTAPIEKMQLFVCMNDDTGTTPVDNSGNANATWWKVAGGNLSLPRMAVNSAPFSELFRGFWNMFLRDAVPDDLNLGTFYKEYRAQVEAWQTGHGDPIPPNAYFPTGSGFANRFYNPYVGSRFGAEATRWTPAPEPAAPLGTFEQHSLRMLRSTLRPPPYAAAPDFFTAGGAQPYRFDAKNMALLRAAIAAVNAEDIRDADNIITKRTIALRALEMPPTPATDPPVMVQMEVTVYGTEKQPFITEVIGNNVVTPSPARAGGYVAIELYNPYATPINLTNYRLARLNRNMVGLGIPPSTYPDMVLEEIPTGVALAGLIIPAGGFVVLESSTFADRPASAGDVPGVPTAPLRATIPGLADGLTNALDHELLILRPLDDTDATLPAIEDCVPVDSYDFTGLVPATPTAVAPIGTAWHYVRACEPTLAAWHMVYPGRYDATKTNEGAVALPRQQGTQVVDWNANTDPDANKDGWGFYAGGAPAPGFTFGAGDSNFTGTPQPPLKPSEDTNGNGIMDPGEDTNGNGLLDRAVYSYSASYPTEFAIQLNNDHWPGRPTAFDATNSNAPTEARFTGFLRNGDILEVPFIGAYRVRTPAHVASAAFDMVEMNSVTMDAAFAEDSDPKNDFDESIGRFIPDNAAITDSALPWYSFARKFFDVVTAIQNSGDDFLPNGNPVHWLTYAGGTHLEPDGTSNTGKVRNNWNDWLAANEGLVNVNTAPWPVLAALPLVLDPASGNVDPGATTDLAKAIVAYRNDPDPQHGPFKSLFDLNKIPSFKTPAGMSANPTEAEGDFSDNGTAIAGIDDFEKRNLELIRLSNMLTVRSDSYTCYLLIQGWRNIGTRYPELVSEQRSAFIVDRSGATKGEVTIPVRSDE